MINVTCPSCKKSFQAPDNAGGKKAICPACQSPISIPTPAVQTTEPIDPIPTISIPTSLPTPALADQTADQDKRFNALRTLSAIIEVTGWIIFVVSVLGLVGAMRSGQDKFAFILPIAGALILLVFLASANLIDLFLAIERNTRKH